MPGPRESAQRLTTLCQLSGSSNLRFYELGCANNRGDAATRKLYLDLAANYLTNSNIVRLLCGRRNATGESLHSAYAHFGVVNPNFMVRYVGRTTVDTHANR